VADRPGPHLFLLSINQYQSSSLISFHPTGSITATLIALHQQITTFWQSLPPSPAQTTLFVFLGPTVSLPNPFIQSPAIINRILYEAPAWWKST